MTRQQAEARGTARKHGGVRKSSEESAVESRKGWPRPTSCGSEAGGQTGGWKRKTGSHELVALGTISILVVYCYVTSHPNMQWLKIIICHFLQSDSMMCAWGVSCRLTGGWDSWASLGGYALSASNRLDPISSHGGSNVLRGEAPMHKHFSILCFCRIY